MHLLGDKICGDEPADRCTGFDRLSLRPQNTLLLELMLPAPLAAAGAKGPLPNAVPLPPLACPFSGSCGGVAGRSRCGVS